MARPSSPSSAGRLSRQFAADDHDALRRHTRFLEEVELAIRSANREVVGARLPALSREAFVTLATAVARLRAEYLEAVLTTRWDNPGDTAFRDLGRARAMYEEAQAGFEALRHAIRMGYAPLGEEPRLPADQSTDEDGDQDGDQDDDEAPLELTR